MVAPSRTPDARGVKCALCQTILVKASWLDQTKLANTINQAIEVLELFDKHRLTSCLCIPKNIENLLIGSTYFEIHRLSAQQLDSHVHQKHKKQLRDPHNLDNKCHDMTMMLLNSLQSSIDYWNSAMFDQASPFNSKLSVRLGLTHHVIYSCYLFKFYKCFQYQLISANLLVHLFKSVECVTKNATAHAYFLLIKALIDCNDLHAAEIHLKEANKLIGRQTLHQQDSTKVVQYEYILLQSVQCELDLLLNNKHKLENLSHIQKLAIIKADDKLQHYYARTLACSVAMRYSNINPTRSDLNFEFYHTYRYVCAILRRCYDSSFELVLREHSSNTSKPNTTNEHDSSNQKNQILDHSWIKFAACDLAFTSFETLAEFFIRAGHPEYMELLFDGLALVAQRTGSDFWQTRIACIGSQIDTICDKFSDAKSKLLYCRSLIAANLARDSSKENLINLLQNRSPFHSTHLELLNIEIDIAQLALETLQVDSIITKQCEDVFSRICRYETDLVDNLFSTKIHSIDELKTLSIDSAKLNKLSIRLILRLRRTQIINLSRNNRISDIYSILKHLSDLWGMAGSQFEYLDLHLVLECIMQLTKPHNSCGILLDTIKNTRLFIDPKNNQHSLESKLSRLTVSDISSLSNGNNHLSNYLPRKTKTEVQERNTRRHLKRGLHKASYTVEHSHKDLIDDDALNHINIEELLKFPESFDVEQISTCYLFLSEPNPSYLLYRQAHELLLSAQLRHNEIVGCWNHDKILYHFFESQSANSMRYRWMSFEEQRIGQYESKKTNDFCPNKKFLKHLAFSYRSNELNRPLKSINKNLTDDRNKLIQIKMILDHVEEVEHWLIVSLELNTLEPIYLHMSRTLTSDDWFQDAQLTKVAEKDKGLKQLTLGENLNRLIEKSKASLTINNKSARSGLRHKLDDELKKQLVSIESEMFDCFRFLILGKVVDIGYQKMINSLVVDIEDNMQEANLICQSSACLRSLIENGLWVSRDDFCRTLGAIYNCSNRLDHIKRAFSIWLKTTEQYISDFAHGMSKASYIQKLRRDHVGLILDQDLEQLPFESIPIIQAVKQGIFRVPSYRFFCILNNRIATDSLMNGPNRINPKRLAYILDPADDLHKTRERFEFILKSRQEWTGVVGQPPDAKQLEHWLSTKDIYLYMGHGAGTSYYNRLCNGRGLGSIENIVSMALVIGCSSAKVQSRGSKLESFGVNWLFIIRGAPSYVGLLWDVTDVDIDRFLICFLENWLSTKIMEGFVFNDEPVFISSCESVAKSRSACQLIYLVGASPVVYGLPSYIDFKK